MTKYGGGTMATERGSSHPGIGPGSDTDLARVQLRTARENARRAVAGRGHAERSVRTRKVRLRMWEAASLAEVVREMTDEIIRAIEEADAHRGRHRRWPTIPQWGRAVRETAPGLRVIAALEDSGCLVIAAKSNTWATQARLIAPMMIKRLNETFDIRSLKTIKILGPRASAPAAGSFPPHPKDAAEPAVRAARDRLLCATPQEPADPARSDRKPALDL